jgi:hypothetical protein
LRAFYIGTNSREWHSLREAFETALAIPELRPILEELSLQYGEI